MSETAERLKKFVAYAKRLKGDEKGEAQVFCDRLVLAFGHAGYKEAGAVLEHRVKKNDGTRGTSFADLVWPGRMLLEMKKRGEKLQSLEQPGKHPLREAHESLDAAVRAAYGMGKREDPLAFLLRLNGLVAKAEAAGEGVTGPGLPASAKGSKKVMSGDCVRMPG